MFLCYMDETGDTGKLGTPYYAVAGVFIKDSAWAAIFDDLLTFRRYLRANFGLRVRDEVKATQLATCAGPWASLGLGADARHRIYRGFMRLQAKTGGIKTFAVVVDKSKLNTKEEIRECAWRYALQRVERFASYNGDTAMLLPDAGDYDIQRKRARRMRRFAPVGGFLAPGTLQRPLVNVIDDPVERQSHESYFIQLADLNAYAAYRRIFPTAKFPPTAAMPKPMWDELGGALLLPVNRLKGGPPGIVLGP